MSVESDLVSIYRSHITMTQFPVEDPDRRLQSVVVASPSEETFDIEDLLRSIWRRKITKTSKSQELLTIVGVSYLHTKKFGII